VVVDWLDKYCEIGDEGSPGKKARIATLGQSATEL